MITSFNRRRFIVGAVGASLGVAGLAGCSNSRATDPNAAGNSVSGDAFSTAKIDWKQFSGTTLAVSAQQHPWWATVEPLISDFTALTGIEVKPSVLGEDQYVAKVAVDLSSGSKTPDLFMVNQFGQATSSGWLEPLDAYLSNAKLTDPTWYASDDFLPGAQAFCKAGGKVMAAPITAEVQMMFLRSDLVKSPPTTFDELLTAAQNATSGNVAGFSSRAVAASNQTPWPYGGFAFSNGGTFIDDAGQPQLASSANIKAAELYAKLISSYGPKGASGWGFLENQQAMQQGRLAIWTDSSTFLGSLRDKAKSQHGDQINAYEFPKGSAKSAPNSWFWTVGINSKSEHKEAAWLFLQWATSKPISEAGAAKGASPARTSAWKSESASATIGTENAQRTLTALQNADSTPLSNAWKNAKWAEVGDPLARAVNATVVGGSAEAEMARAQAAATKILGA